MPTQPASEEVAFWELDLENEGQPVPVSHSVQPCIRTSGIVDIGIFEDQEDVRIPVNEADVKPGGKYHGSNASLPPQLPSLPSKPPKADRLKKSYNAAIVKLFSRFGASETWTTATGWLLKDDIVVTAAHCVYNNSQRATSVKVCIGYNAKGSKDANVSAACEQRFVNRIALPLEWITAETEPHDMAFLQLKSPFQNVTPIVCDTPEINAWRQLTVIGYPTDLGTSGEPGGEMCEMKIDRDINLKRTRWNMLAYQGDLQGGLSGAPVIRDSDFTAIGVHVRGGSFNSAAVINGPHGVRFQAYEDVMRILEKGGGDTDSGLEPKTDSDKKWLKYVHVPYSP